MMKRIILLIGLAAALSLSSFAKQLTYSADYHLGFVKINAGSAVVDYNIDGNNIAASFNGHSIPWHGTVYSISDTLQAAMTEVDGHYYESVINEAGWYTKPKLAQLQSGDFDASDPSDYRTIYGRGSLNASDETMEAVTITADMLALFYYFQTIEFESLNVGQKINIDITLPDGDTQQALITYNGIGEFNGTNVYKVSFEYSYHGEMSDYPVTCMIDRTSRVPLFFSADIKIGHVELVLS